ncbi:hypothetical protein ABK814_18390 [Enterobacter hormaechei]|uniref:hypothetical protein n=1 Tax=Enterobacteriaceae TaxID=543 RepID=UPI00079B7561|nr:MULTISPECIES: hypothetical protein [Enterobacteriaceae]MDE4745132.1 hypothetical protein [Klebsiella pneumoniae]SAE40662.1 Uncharacterised protein [Enterobacter hormaechei]SAI45505.1 Uncharacterised protein [Enterobacter hormaechei]
MMEFTKEQLIAHIAAKAARIKPDSQVNDSLRIEALMNKRELEIALASLTAPDDIPLHVLDAMSGMCDAGFNAQGIWDLCRKSILPPEPCPRCGIVSDRPDGAHYCHARG